MELKRLVFKGHLGSNHWNLGPLYITQQMGIMVPDGSEVANWLNLKWKGYPRLSGWPWYNHKGSFKVQERGRRVRIKVMHCKKDTTDHCWLWRWKKTISQGMLATCSNWKRLGNRASPHTSRRSRPCWCLDFRPVRCMSDVWPPEFYDNKVMLF